MRLLIGDGLTKGIVREAHLVDDSAWADGGIIEAGTAGDHPPDFVGGLDPPNGSVDPCAQCRHAVLNGSAELVEVEAVNGSQLIRDARRLTGPVVGERDLVAGTGAVGVDFGAFEQVAGDECNAASSNKLPTCSRDERPYGIFEYRRSFPVQIFGGQNRRRLQ